MLSNHTHLGFCVKISHKFLIWIFWLLVVNCILLHLPPPPPHLPLPQRLRAAVWGWWYCWMVTALGCTACACSSLASRDFSPVCSVCWASLDLTKRRRYPSVRTCCAGWWAPRLGIRRHPLCRDWSAVYSQGIWFSSLHLCAQKSQKSL